MAAELRRICSCKPVARIVACPRSPRAQSGGCAMTYSFTQISQYLTCPRRYRYRYLNGWKEKDTRAAMLFGRAFENALGAFFRHEDSGAALFREWTVLKGLACTTRTATAGTACCGRASGCLSALPKMTASGFT